MANILILDSSVSACESQCYVCRVIATLKSFSSTDQLLLVCVRVTSYKICPTLEPAICVSMARTEIKALATEC